MEEKFPNEFGKYTSNTRPKPKTRKRKKQKTDVSQLTGGQHDVNNLATEINPRNVKPQETKTIPTHKKPKKRSAKKKSNT